MKAIRIAIVLIALVTTACSGGTISPSAVASRPIVATASQTHSPTATPTASPPRALEGIWTTSEITCDQQLATIHQAGFTDAQITAANWVCPQPLYESLRFLGERMGQFEESREGFELGAQFTFKLTDDHTLALAEIGYQPVPPRATLTFTLVGNVLNFTSLSSNAADNGASIFDQIAGPAIFLSAPFTKEP
jgi:hypothetical protein